MTKYLFKIFIANICIICILSYCTSRKNKKISIAPISLSTEHLDSLLNIYYHLKNALVEDNLEGSKSSVVILKNFASQELQLENKHPLFNLLHNIIESENLEETRFYFESLSKFIYHSFKKSKIKSTSTVYKQFCPMAFKNKGAFWLSAQDDIKNPYFGESMLECGIVEEEL